MDSSILTGQFLEVMAGLAAVIALIYLIAFVLKRFQIHVPGQGHIRLLHTVQLGAKERLVIVEVDGRRMLLGVSAGGVNRICTMERETVEHSTAKHGKELFAEGLS